MTTTNPSPARQVRRAALAVGCALAVVVVVMGDARRAWAAPEDAKPSANTTTTKKPTTGANKTNASTAKPGAKEKDPTAPIIAAAIEKLTAEYRGAVKGGSSLRAEANYFKESTPPELTPEKVVAAIGKPVASDPSLDSYVRWQLLGAIPGEVDEKLAPKVMAVYRSAPRPPQRLGSTPDERREIERLGRGRDVDVVAINEQYNKALDQRAVVAGPVFSFRDELFARLPTSPDTFVAGMSDAADRYNAGHRRAGDEQMRAIADRVSLWAISAEDPRQKAAVFDAAQKLRKLKGVEYPAALEKATEGNQITWRTETSRPQSQVIDEIEDALKGGGTAIK
jgi:hypothetical protein